MPSAAAIRRATGETGALAPLPPGEAEAPPAAPSGPGGGGRRGGRGRRAAAAAVGGPGTRAHARDDLADGHGVAGVGEDLGDRPSGRGRQLHVDLVRRQLDDRLAVGHLVADADGPLEDRALGHRLAAAGRDDVEDLAGLRRRPRRVSAADAAVAALEIPDAVGDLGQDRADGDGVARGGADPGQGARRGRGHVGVHLVGGDLDEGLALRDGFAFLLVPFEDGALADRLAHRRQRHLGSRVHCHDQRIHSRRRVPRDVHAANRTGRSVSTARMDLGSRP